jgi:hypothetical protein
MLLRWLGLVIRIQVKVMICSYITELLDMCHS